MGSLAMQFAENNPRSSEILRHVLDGDGMDLAEFTIAMHNRTHKLADEQIEHIFRHHDTDTSGFITGDEVEQMLEDLTKLGLITGTSQPEVEAAFEYQHELAARATAKRMHEHSRGKLGTVTAGSLSNQVSMEI